VAQEARDQDAEVVKGGMERGVSLRKRLRGLGDPTENGFWCILELERIAYICMLATYLIFLYIFATHSHNHIHS